MTVLPRYMVSDVLDWCHRVNRDHRPELIAVAALVTLLGVGLVVAGESELEACAAKIAATSPAVAAAVTDPTVEQPPAPVGSVATDCEEGR